MTDPDYWFPAKRYGYGWGAPRTWQGWAVIAAYLLVVTGPFALLAVVDEAVVVVLSVLGVVVGTPLLILVCVRKGEPAQWRWGSGD